MANTTVKDKVLYLELVDRQNSGYEKEGSREEGHPVFMDAPDRRRILSRSQILCEDGKTLRVIRYIKGCDTIFEDEQQKRNIQPNPLTDVIWFEGSQTKTVRNIGADMPLFAYLAACPFNENAPNRPEGSPTIFREIHAEVVAKQGLEDLDSERAIGNIIGELYEKTADGYSYDEVKIGYYLTLLRINPFETPAENLVAINRVAKADPDKFLSTIASKTKEYRIEIMEAIKLDVIDVKGDRAVWVEGQGVFTKSMRVKTQDEKIDFLTRYFLSPEGVEDYKTMITRLDTAKEKALQLV